MGELKSAEKANISFLSGLYVMEDACVALCLRSATVYDVYLGTDIME